MIPVEFDQGIFFALILWSFVIGILLGVIYDVFRIRRIAFSPEMRIKTKVNDDKPSEKSAVEKASKIKVFIRKNIEIIDFILIFVEDIIFMTFAAVVIVLMTYKLNSGKVRWFAVAPAVAGFTLYHITVGRIVKKCAESIIRFIRLLIMWIIRLTILPVSRLVSKAIFRIKAKIMYKRITGYTRKREKAILKMSCQTVGRTEEKKEPDIEANNTARQAG